MKYTKPALTFQDQADLLIKRGLVGSRDEIVEKLQAVNYYRLSAYWYTFRQSETDDLTPGTSLTTVWSRYTFDRQIRLLVMDAVERVEIAFRTQVVNRHSLAHGPFGYIDPATLPGLNKMDHDKFLIRLREETDQDKEVFVQHFRGKYTAEKDLPLWMACELMTFGSIFTLFRGLDDGLKKAVGRQYGVSDVVIESWLRTMNQVRNLCAHHARLWNRVFGLRPQIPYARKHPEWHDPVAITNDRLFGVLTVLHYLLKQVAPRSHWRQRLEKLFSDYHDIPLPFMGFPANWKESPIWQSLGVTE